MASPSDPVIGATSKGVRRMVRNPLSDAAKSLIIQDSNTRESSSTDTGSSGSKHRIIDCPLAMRLTAKNKCLQAQVDGLTERILRAGEKEMDDFVENVNLQLALSESRAELESAQKIGGLKGGLFNVSVFLNCVLILVVGVLIMCR